MRPMSLTYKQNNFNNYKILKHITGELICSDVTEALDTSLSWELSM